jgi:hypothetical protein
MTDGRKLVKPSAKSLANLKPCKKGEIRNPEGARSHNKALQALRKFGQKEYSDIIEYALTNNLKALHKVIKDPETSAIKVGVAKALLNAINFSDWNIINQIAERLVGKPAQKIELKTETDLSHLSDDDLEQVKKILMKNQNENPK